MGLAREIARPPNLATLTFEVVMVRQFLARSPAPDAGEFQIVYPEPRQLLVACGAGLSPFESRNAFLQIVRRPRLMSADRLAEQAFRQNRPLNGARGWSPLVSVDPGARFLSSTEFAADDRLVTVRGFDRRS